MDAVVLAAIAAGLGGFVSSIYAVILHSQAERSLVRSLRNKQELARRLGALRVELESGSPDPEDVTRARQIVADATDVLSERYKKTILGTLDQGSDKSKANYLVKLLREVDKSAA